MPKTRLILCLIVIALAAACAPAPSELSADDQVATIVAATIQAQVAPPTETSEPIDGEIETVQSSYGTCANTGQISVAYIKDGNVYLWVQGGAPAQLTNSGDASDLDIADDGCRIAYVRNVPNPNYNGALEFPGPDTTDELWIVNSDGSSNEEVVGQEFLSALPSLDEGQAYSVHKFAWQPGTHTLAFGTRTTFTGPGLAPNNDIYLINANAPAGVITLLPPAQGGEFNFSQDGQLMAFTTPTNAGVVAVDGSDLRPYLATFPMVMTYSEYAYYPPVHWAPDGNSFMLAVPPEDGLAGPVGGVYPETTLWYVPLDGTPAFDPGAVQTAWFVTQEVQFSPDLGRIAYIRQYGEVEAGTFELVIALSNGSNEAPTVQANEIMFGDWSPESNRYIYYITQGPDLSLFFGSVDSSNVAPISRLTAFQAAAAEVEWVEGDSFVLLVQGDAGVELSLMETSGAGVIIDTSGFSFMPFDVAN